MPDLSYCAAEVKRFDYDRFLCSLFAPAEQRDALFALYAFNSAIARVPETVTEPMMGDIRLQWWSDRIEEIYAGGSPQDEIARALGAAVRAHRLTRARFDALIEARRGDLDPSPPADLDALIAYAESTSANLTMIALEILGGADEEAVGAAARHVGIAWALSGLIRALPYHAARGRVYLPVSLCAAAGLDLELLLGRKRVDEPERSLREPLRLVVAQVAEVAAGHVASARRLRAQMPRRVVAALLPASLAASDLKRLARCGGDPFDERVQARSGLRLLRLGYNALRGRY